MSLRLNLYVFGWLAGLLVAHAATPSTLFGKVDLAVPQGSALRSQVEPIIKEHCENPELASRPSVVVPDVKGRCVTVRNGELINNTDDTGVAIAKVVNASPSSDGSSTVVTWYPVAWTLVGAQPVPSSCGRWRYRAMLDLEAPQTPSRLMLWHAGGGAGPGGYGASANPFAGTLSVQARLHLENVDQGYAFEVPLQADLGVRGSWSLSATSPLGGDRSNLILTSPLIELWWAEQPGCWRCERVWMDAGDLFREWCDLCRAPTEHPEQPS